MKFGWFAIIATAAILYILINGDFDTTSSQQMSICTIDGMSTFPDGARSEMKDSYNEQNDKQNAYVYRKYVSTCMKKFGYTLDSRPDNCQVTWSIDLSLNYYCYKPPGFIKGILFELKMLRENHSTRFF